MAFTTGKDFDASPPVKKPSSAFVPVEILVDFDEALQSIDKSSISQHSFSSSANSIATVLNMSGLNASPGIKIEAESEFQYEGVASGSNNGYINLVDSPAEAFSKKPNSANSSFNKSVKNVTTNALASQLYYGRPYGSSARSASRNRNHDDGAALSGDDGMSVSEPELSHDKSFLSTATSPSNNSNLKSSTSDLHDISDHVHRLEHNLYKLAEQQMGTDDRYVRLKQENAVLQERLHNLDEQLLANEERWKRRLLDDEQKHKEMHQRLLREKTLELDSCVLRCEILQRERDAARQDVARAEVVGRASRDEATRAECSARAALDELDEAKRTLKERLDKTWKNKEETERKLNEALNAVDQLKRENDEMKSHFLSGQPLNGSSSDVNDANNSSSCSDYEQGVRPLRDEIKNLREKNSELHAQLLQASVEQGRRLLDDNAGAPSLAEELDGMTKDQVKVLHALKEQEIVNRKLRLYVDGILLRIIENDPSLLEIKPGEKHLRLP